MKGASSPMIEPRGSMNNFHHLINIIWHGSHPEPVYGISSPGAWGIGEIRFRFAILIVFGALVACSLIPPALCAVSAEVTTLPPSKDTLAQDNPEMIAALKIHVAYVGQSQDARMSGVISYIDRISGNTGSGTLREIHDDYLAVASLLPVMQTADDIAEARRELQHQSRLFAEETRVQLIFFNGTTGNLREAISVSEQAAEGSLMNLKDSLWLSHESARMTTFNRESQKRAVILKSLSDDGVDVSMAQDISEQIDAQRTDIQKAISARSLNGLKATNAALKSLNREFRATIGEYQTRLRIETKRSAILAME
jgi:hypothetical protein